MAIITIIVKYVLYGALFIEKKICSHISNFAVTFLILQSYFSFSGHLSSFVVKNRTFETNGVAYSNIHSCKTVSFCLAPFVD